MTDLEQGLSEAFEAVWQSTSAPPNLADRVRRGVRRRRQRRGALLAAAAVVTAASVVAVITTGSSSQRPAAAEKPPVTIAAQQVSDMATEGSRLYIASGDYPDATLAVYDRSTGARLASVALPARPTSVAVAPYSSIWVSFSPTSAGGEPGVAELTPDLSGMSTVTFDDGYLDAAAFSVLPLSVNVAFVATDHGLITVNAAAPRARVKITHPAAVSNSRVYGGIPPDFGAPTQMLQLRNGNIAMQTTSDSGSAWLYLVEDHSRPVLGKRPPYTAGSEVTAAASPAGLWVTSQNPRPHLSLLNSSLGTLATTVSPSGSILSGVTQVATSNQTVWVVDGGQRARLQCFAYSSRVAGIAGTVTLPLGDSANETAPPAPTDLQVLPTPDVVYVAGPNTVTGYTVPPVCRTQPA